MVSRIVVSNATPLIALAWLNRLDLLPTLFDTVHIPQAVHDEIQHNPEAVGAAELSTAPWLEISPVQYSKLVSDVISTYLPDQGCSVLPFEPPIEPRSRQKNNPVVCVHCRVRS